LQIRPGISVRTFIGFLQLGHDGACSSRRDLGFSFSVAICPLCSKLEDNGTFSYRSIMPGLNSRAIAKSLFGKIPFLARMSECRDAAFIMDGGQITHIGRIDFRNDNRVFGIKHEDRFSHVYVIGHDREQT
jgi:hypothetical protein